jgi:transcriptional regulator with XRE-family HTH domain
MKACDIDYKVLRRLRQRSGKTATAVAQELGISLSHVSEFERGQKGLSMGLLRRLLGLYGLDLEIWAVDGDREPPIRLL